MFKEEVVISFNNRDIIEKIVSKFGNGAHVSISKEYIGKNVKIVVGESRIVGQKMYVDFLESVIFGGKVSKFGTGAHIIIPKEYSGKKIKIIIEKEEENKNKNKK